MARILQREQRSKFYGLNFADPKYSGGSEGRSDFKEASDLNNIRFTDDAKPAARKGRDKVDADSYTTDAIHTLGWFEDSSGTEHLIVAAGNDIFTDALTVFPPVTSHTLTTPDKRATIETYANHLWYVDGNNGNLKYDGTNWYNLGIAAPAAAPAVADGGAGVLTGTYQYVYVYVYKNVGLGYEVESKASALSAEFVAAAKQIDVDVVASTDAQVNFIRIYRISSVAAELQRVAEIANTTTTYTDNVADNALGAAMVDRFEGEPLDASSVAVKFDGVVAWKDRLWGWKGPTLYYSKAGKPEVWWNDESDFQPITIENETGRKIIKCIPFRNNLIVYTEDKMFIVSGDIEPWAVLDYRNNIGCISDRSPVVCQGYLQWLSNGGMYQWNGVDEPLPISDPVDNDFEGTSRGIMESPNTSLAFVKGIYVPDEKLTLLSTPFTSAVFNSRTFVYDHEIARQTPLSPWSLWDDLSFVDAVINPARVMYSAATTAVDGKYYYKQEFLGTQDEGTDVANVYYETRHWDFGTTLMDKKMFYLGANGYTTGTDITFKTIVDFGQFTDTFDLSTGGDEFDVALWDDGEWAGANLVSIWTSYPQDTIGTILGFRIEMDKDAVFHSFDLQFMETRRYMT